MNGLLFEQRQYRQTVDEQLIPESIDRQPVDDQLVLALTCNEYLQLMGNKASKIKKIVILDAENQQQDFQQLYQREYDGKFQCQYFSNFQNFVEMVNIKNVYAIILRSKEVDIYQNGQKIDYQNAFTEVCPLLTNNDKSMKQKVIMYIRKFSIEVPVYAIDFGSAMNSSMIIKEHEKPYIKMVALSLDSVLGAIETKQKKKHISDKFLRLIKDMSRKIVVKVIDPRHGKSGRKEDLVMADGELPATSIEDEQKLFKDSGLSYEYFRTVEEFSKSCISTSTEYVVVGRADLVNLIDNKILYDMDYSIILRVSKGDRALEKLDKKKIWFLSQEIRQIIQKIKQFSVVGKEQQPLLSSNTILCGSSQLYQNNYSEIRRKIEAEFNKEPRKAEQFVKMNMHFLRAGEDFSAILQILKESLYSYIVVFESGSYLEALKNFLLVYNFANRVQLTNIDEPTKPMSDYQLLDFKVDYFCNKIKFKIKFEIAPLRSIHLFRPIPYVTAFFKDKMALQIIEISSFRQLESEYLSSHDKIIESRLMICSVDSFSSEIVSHLDHKTDKWEHVFGQTKYIIVDDKRNINRFITEPNNYRQQIAYVHCNLNSVKEFLEFFKVPMVSIPYFPKGSLSCFNQVWRHYTLNKISQEIALTTSVVSDKEILKELFSNQIEISTSYQLLLISFNIHQRAISQHITYFEGTFLESYSKLWNLGYDLLKRERGRLVNLEIVKQDLIMCFNKCKIYDLLSIRDEDYHVFYIDKINECRSFVDLQTACIYILTLPHGFRNVLNQLFKRTRQSQLVIKVFVHFFVIIFTCFYQFREVVMQKIQLVAYFEEEELSESIKSLKEGDVLFTSSFTFCSDLSETTQQHKRHCIVFEIQSIQFLRKGPISNWIEIQPFSFYKESAEYLLPPFSKFEISSTTQNAAGKYEIVLKESGRAEFIRSVLQRNDITQERVVEILKWESQRRNSKFFYNDNILAPDTSSYSLYKKAEMENLEQSQNKMLRYFLKNLTYLKFLNHLQHEQYNSALVQINQRIAQYRKEEEETGITNLKLRLNKKLFHLEKALISYKMCEYLTALNSLHELRKDLVYEQGVKEDSWMIDKISIFIKEVQICYNNRRRVFETAPKTKRWKVRAKHHHNAQMQTTEIYFHLHSHKCAWKVNYYDEVETFTMENSDLENADLLIAAKPVDWSGENQLFKPGNNEFYTTLDRDRIVVKREKLFRKLPQRLPSILLPRQKNKQLVEALPSEAQTKRSKKSLTKSKITKSNKSLTKSNKSLAKSNKPLTKESESQTKGNKAFDSLMINSNIAEPQNEVISGTQAIKSNRQDREEHKATEGKVSQGDGTVTKKKHFHKKLKDFSHATNPSYKSVVKMSKVRIAQDRVCVSHLDFRAIAAPRSQSHELDQFTSMLTSICSGHITNFASHRLHGWHQILSSFADPCRGVKPNQQLMNEQEFKEDWVECYSSWHKHATPAQKQQCLQFDLCVHKCIIKSVYQIDNIEQINQLAKRYQQFVHDKLNYVHDGQRVVELLEKHSVDIMFIQGTNSLLINELNNSSRYYAVPRRHKKPGFQNLQHPNNCTIVINKHKFGEVQNLEADNFKMTKIYNELSATNFQDDLSSSSGTLYQVIDKLIIISFGFSPSQHQNLLQVQAMKKLLEKVKSILPEYGFVAAGNMAGQFDHGFDLLCEGGKVVKLSALPCPVIDTQPKGKQSPENTDIWMSSDIRDYVLTDRVVSHQKIVPISETQEMQSTFILNDTAEHCFMTVKIAINDDL